MNVDLEAAACTPVPVDPRGFNPRAVIPHGVTTAHIRAAMEEFADWLGFINAQNHGRQIQRMESFLMPANFSSMVGEFMSANIPKHCATIVKNRHHNGHPDLIPPGVYPNDDVLHGSQGIEIKASRYTSGWQGHNAEATFLMVFVYASSRPTDEQKGILPQPFRFLYVYAAQLEQVDWSFAGRSETSRRTITATVLPTGFTKMSANWVYKDPAIGNVAALGLFDGDDGA